MSMEPALCALHEWQYVEYDGETWNECVVCGFRELWAGGVLIASTDMSESNRLDGWELSK